MVHALAYLSIEAFIYILLLKKGKMEWWVVGVSSWYTYYTGIRCYIEQKIYKSGFFDALLLCV